jgi:hypothetical protein
VIDSPRPARRYLQSRAGETGCLELREALEADPGKGLPAALILEYADESLRDFMNDVGGWWGRGGARGLA